MKGFIHWAIFSISVEFSLFQQDATASREYIERNRECAPEKPLTFGSGRSLVRPKIVVRVSGLNNEEQKRPCTQVPHIQNIMLTPEYLLF